MKQYDVSIFVFHCLGSNGSQFRGVSAGKHFIEVEKIDSVDQVTVSITIDVPEMVVSFSKFQSK